MWPFDTGDCLIEVTTWPGFTAYYKNINKSYKSDFRGCVVPVYI
jgi:hypothetical protein